MTDLGQSSVGFSVNSTSVTVSAGSVAYLELSITLNGGATSGVITSVQVKGGALAVWFDLKDTLPKTIVGQTTLRFSVFVPPNQNPQQYTFDVAIVVTSGSSIAMSNGHIYVMVESVEWSLTPLESALTITLILAAVTVCLCGLVLKYLRRR